MKRAIYPGTFDPPHNGHLDLIRRAARLFDEVIVAVAESAGKGTMFSSSERVEMVQEMIADVEGVRTVPFEGMLIHEFERQNVDVAIRGVRLFQDFEYEYTMALMNRRLCPTFDVLFLMPSEKYLSVSSTLIKDIHHHGGELSEIVPPCVLRRLESRPERGGAT